MLAFEWNGMGEEEEDELSSRGATATAVAEAVLLKRSHFRAGLTRTTRGGHTINFPAAAAVVVYVEQEPLSHSH